MKAQSHAQFKSCSSRVSMPGLLPPSDSSTALAQGWWMIPTHHSRKTRTNKQCWGHTTLHSTQLQMDLSAAGGRAGEALGSAVSCLWTVPEFPKNGSLCMWKTSDSIPCEYWESKAHSKENKCHMPEVCSLTVTATQPCSMHRSRQMPHTRRGAVLSHPPRVDF